MTVLKPATTDAVAEAKAQVSATITDAIDRLLACACEPTGTDVILAWENGLAVRRVVAEGRRVSYQAGSIHAAHDFTDWSTASYPPIINGHGDRAVPTTRRDAALKYAEELRKTRAEFEAR